jgi:glucose/arabinose dehydrogenase
VKGFRNPIGIRSQRGHDLCFAVELSKDYSATEGGREKLVPIRPGDDWGFPCCATKDTPYNVTPQVDCSRTTPENVSFVIGDTPFDVDFAPAAWPAPYAGSAFVPLHGVVSTWTGARLVAIEIDPMTGLPRDGSDTGGSSRDAMSDFATGWDDGTHLHGRPANITFAPDGRLFLGNDNDGTIIWIAPIDLPR